jgi:hypothetical protein
MGGSAKPRRIGVPHRVLVKAFSVALALILAFACVPKSFAQDQSSGDPYADAIGRAASERQSGDFSDAFIDYLKGINLALSPADSASTRDDLFRMVASNGLPHTLTASQISAIKAQHGTVEVLDESQDIEMVAIDGSGLNSLDSISDPQYHWPFPAIIGEYQPDFNAPGALVLNCNIHYQTSGDQEFAVHTGRLLALLRQVLETKSGQTPAYSGAFNVWLSRSESSVPGGEEWQNNVYLYNIGDARSSIEWIREIAHEYSHLAFPPLGGSYTSPEAWANGYAGERLLVRWLDDPAVAGPSVVEDAWGHTFSGYVNFNAKLINPALSLYESRGLDRKWLGKHDDIGMRYVIGLLLWVDMNKGSDTLGNLLWDMQSPDPASLYAPGKALGLVAAPNPLKSKKQPT